MPALDSPNGTRRSSPRAGHFSDTYVMAQPEIKIPSAAPLFDPSAKLIDETTRQYVRKFLEAFAAWIARFKD